VLFFHFSIVKNETGVGFFNLIFNFSFSCFH
jgi:hypothetical protein